MGNLIQQFVQNSIVAQNEGKNLIQQSIENYITEVLDMEVIESENLGDKNSYQDVIKVVAKRKDSDAEYTFVSDYYQCEEFTPRENCLILQQIKGEEGLLKVEETLYMTNHSDDFNKKHKLLNTPLSKLISGETQDAELSFVIDLLKENLENKKGYKYTEEQKGNLKSFIITLNDEIRIERGMSNTIQVTFQKKRLQSLQIIFRDVSEDKLKEEVEQLTSLVDEYFDWKITIDGKHNISELYDFLVSKKLSPDIVTSSIMKSYPQSMQLFRSIVIGEWDSYKQVSLNVNYNYKTQQFELISNYLFKETEVICNTVDEIKEVIEEIEKLLS